MTKLTLPRYLKWRDGRPRWELGGRGRAEMEAAGFRSRDLRAPDGQWMKLEAAMAEADRLNHRVDAWRCGETPEDATGEAAPVARPKGQRVIADLFRAYERTPGFLTAGENTRRIYRSYAATAGAWIGDLSPAAFDRRLARRLYDGILDVNHWRDERRAAGDGRRNDRWHPDFLRLPKAVREAVNARRLEAMEEADGQPSGYTGAFYLFAWLKMVWEWALDEELVSGRNPMRKMRLGVPQGRVREITDAEFAHLDAVAIAMGRPEAGDAWALAIASCQRRSDLAGLTWETRGNIGAGGNQPGRVRLTQQKTGALVDFQTPDVMRVRLDAMWERQKAAGLLRADRVLVSSLDGQSFEDRLNKLTDLCREVRREAAKTMPSVADILLHDGRDTGITRLFRADCDLIRVCEISGHTPDSADTIRKAYLKSNSEVADQAIASVNAYAERKGLKN
jgi:hypothetical protein